jgi:FtsH-binding integral membrane protein
MALYILVAYNLIMMGVGYWLIQSNQVSANARGKLVRNIIFLVAIAEMVAIQFVKRAMLARTNRKSPPEQEPKPQTINKELQNITLVIAAMCSAISTYGLVLLTLGEKFDVLLFFVALSLVAYQLFRLRPKDFRDSPEP